MVIFLKGWRGNIVVKFFTTIGPKPWLVHLLRNMLRIFQDIPKELLRKSWEQFPGNSQEWVLKNFSREILKNFYKFYPHFLRFFCRIGNKKFPGIGDKKILGQSHENFLGMGYEKFLGIAIDIFTGFSCERFLGISADFGTPLPCILKHHGLSRKTQASSILWVNVPIHPTLLTFSLASGRKIGFLASHHSINNYEPIVVLLITNYLQTGFLSFP